MKNKKIEIIHCPNCGAEYLPAEIYMPNAFLGKPLEVERDHCTHTIMDFSGRTMDTVEHYCCDYCGTPFKVVAKVQFQTVEEADFNFEKEYTSSLKKESLFLRED